MPHRTIRFAFVSSFLLLIVIATATAQETKQENAEFRINVGPGEFVNDRSVYEQLSKVGEELLKEEGLLKSPEIVEMLSVIPSSVKVELPEATKGQNRKRSFDSTVIVGFLYDCGKCDSKHVGIATGVAISSDGLILTNHHVFEGKSNFIHFVMTRDGRVFPVEKVLAGHQANDIALIKIDATDLTCSPIASTVPQPLDDLYTVSHPERNFFYASSGRVARYVEIAEGKVKTRWLQFDGDFSKGSSGGPVFDTNGNVIGLMTRQIPKLTEKGSVRIMFHECVPVQVINDFVTGRLLGVKDAALDW